MAKGPVPLAVNVTPPLLHLMDDPIWRAEFRGFFLGEGWLGIVRAHKRRNGGTSDIWVYRPEVNITQAAKNRDVVFHIRDVLGGFVYERSPYVHGSDKQRRGPYYTWMARSNPISRRAYTCLADGHLWTLDKKWEPIECFGKFLDLLDKWNGATKPPEVMAEIEELRHRVHPHS